VTKGSYERVVIAYLLAVILALVVFAAFPAIDLTVSRVFAEPAEGFDWARGPAAVINLIIRRIGEAVSFLLICACAFGAVTGRMPGTDVRALAYPALSVVLASGGIVNLLLKSHVGRARPDSLAEFGGRAEFSPAWQVVSECGRNCSFASGEVAMSAGLAIPMVVLIWPQLTSRRSRLLAVALAAGYVTLVALLRIGLGRHFLSDTIFSILIAGAVALVLFPVLQIENVRGRFSLLARIGRVRHMLIERQARRSGARRRVS
jgi:lipid A 4'-phosphatase